MLKLSVMVKLSAIEILNKFSKNSSHANEVNRLSMIIFEEVNSKIKEMPDKYKKYLQAGALLHDIGYYRNSKAHNKHSMEMLLEFGLDGFSETEEKISACICRYHRGGLPDKIEHEIYNTLDKKERKAVKRLAGILKIADGLDDGHMHLIKDIRIDYDEVNNIAQFIITPTNPEFLPDITPAIRKRDLFEIAFKCQSVLKLNQL